MKVKQYRRKPIVFEAIQLTDNVAHNREVAKWCGADSWQYGSKAIAIQTLEGTMNAEVGDYIIKGVKGEFYPVKADIFEATYDEEFKERDMKLYEIPRNSKILLSIRNDLEQALEYRDQMCTFDHIDGMYSHITTPDGSVVHLSASAPVKKVDDHYELDEVEDEGELQP